MAANNDPNEIFQTPKINLFSSRINRDGLKSAQNLRNINFMQSNK